MHKAYKYSNHLLLILTLMAPVTAYASDDDSPFDDTLFNSPVLPDDPLSDSFSNPLFKAPVNSDVEEDLTTARDEYILDEVIKELADSPTLKRKRDHNDVVPPEDLPDEAALQELLKRIKVMNDEMDKLIEKNKAIAAQNQVDQVIVDYWNKIQKLKVVPHAYLRALREFESLQQLPRNSSESIEIRKYLDWLCRLPWAPSPNVEIDLGRAKFVLDKAHSGLGKIKERIIEELAVRKRLPNGKQPILCFVGPPGVGKTTLAMAIAEATKRKFVRISLGGVRDEPKIRGFLRTYIGAQPGQILKSVIEVDDNRPLILLDEIDKLASESTQGDPAAALLEVLDQSQNNKFVDHYVDIPFDLSKVMFIATANSYNIAGPLLDRMEIIDLSSYTQKEKLEIARTNLVPKVMQEKGLKANEAIFMDNALAYTISNYTAEAGVRDLERCIGTLCRKAVAGIDSGAFDSVVFDQAKVREYLGKPKAKPTAAFTEHKVGATQGLAWTSVGGTLLPIEASVVSGSGKLIATGNLGNVMTESVTYAEAVMKMLMPEYGITVDKMKDKDIHVHAPEAAIKKDGPSAGVTITTSLMSAITGIPVSKNVAMTGEINLHGDVLAIGGLKEKLIAAHTAGVTRALIPKANEDDLEDLPEEVVQGMEIIPVKHIREVLKYALVRED